MIVDDEPLNIQGLVRYIKWHELGYEIPVTMESGEEALEALVEMEIDVLISDVCMPGMGGIELVAQSKSINPHLQVLMISGYNEFEFVQDAIHVGAQAYVLKPLKLEEVSEKLTTMRLTLEKTRHIIEQTSEMEKKISSSLNLVKERFVSDLIAGITLTDEMLASWSDLMTLPVSLRNVQLIIFGLDQYLTSGSDATERTLLGSGFKKTVNIGLSDLEPLILAQVKPDEIVALHINLAPDERVILEKQLHFIQTMVQEQYGCTVTIGYSRTGSQWNELADFYKEVKFMMAQAKLVEEGQIVRHAQIDKMEFNGFRLREEFMPNIVKLMEAGDESKVSEYLNRVLTILLSQEQLSFSHAQALSMSFLSELISMVKWRSTVDSDFNIVMWRRLLDCNSTNEIIDMLVECVNRYMRVEKPEHQNQQHHLIKKVAAFIEERIQESWTVKELAEQFNLNASYLSVLFKKEMDKTISEYVQETRITLAKRLLQDPNIKVYEVAEQVGIQTSAYFTYLFKKIVGCTPQEFRDHHYSSE